MVTNTRSRKLKALTCLKIISIATAILASGACLLTVISLPSLLRSTVTRYPGAVEERNCSDHPDPEYGLSADSYVISFGGVYRPCLLTNDPHQVVDAWYRQQGWEWYKSWDSNDPYGMGKQETEIRVGPLFFGLAKSVDTFDRNGQTEISFWTSFSINLVLPNSAPLP